MATRLLESVRQTEQKAEEEQRAREEAERPAILKAEEERPAAEKVEAERKAKQKAKEERIAREKAEVERLAREKLAMQKAIKVSPEREAEHKLEKELMTKTKIGEESRDKQITTTQTQEAKQKPSYAAAIGLHLLFGFGLFYVDRSIRRKWVYPALILYAILDVGLASQGIEPFESADFGGGTFVLALGIYLLSFIDVVIACRKARA